MNLLVYFTEKMPTMHATTTTKKHSKIKKNEGEKVLTTQKVLFDIL